MIYKLDSKLDEIIKKVNLSKNKNIGLIKPYI